MNGLRNARSHHIGAPLRAALLGLSVLALALSAMPVAAASGGQSGFAAARAATAAFHDPSCRAGGRLLRGRSRPGRPHLHRRPGRFGRHGRPLPEPGAARRVGLGDDARAPRVRTRPAWQLRLVALEYLVLKSDWDAAHGGPGATPPSLFGQAFDLTLAGNRYGLPDFYSLHAWLWDPNPSGMFAEWNPRVTCP